MPLLICAILGAIFGFVAALASQGYAHSGKLGMLIMSLACAGCVWLICLGIGLYGGPFWLISFVPALAAVAYTHLVPRFLP